MTKDKKILCGIAALLAVVAIVGFSISFYRQYRASCLLEEANKEMSKLKDTINLARSSLKNNFFLMTGPEETDPLDKEIAEVEEAVNGLEAAIASAKSTFSSGKHVEVREALESENSPIRKSISYQDRLRSKVIQYCNGKRNKRDTTVSNEWFLKARLKKPIDGTFQERPEELQNMPPQFFAMIPKATDELLKGLSSLNAEAGGEGDPRLFNSLGANLLAHRSELEHIEKFGKTETIKEKAREMYRGAVSHYVKVRDANDALSNWYRAEKNDGKYSVDDYQKLLAEQEAPVNDIHQGDNLLQALSNYLSELHEQCYVYVSEHRKKHTEFRHTRSHTSVDSKGRTHTTYSSYYTDGYKYYYVLTTVRPGSQTEEEIYVGEIDSTWREWDYSQDEEVGWVRKWKLLHEDNTMLKRGWLKDLKPMIEKE